MKNNMYKTTLLSVGLILPLCVYGQEATSTEEIDRTVTVEREFQPAIQPAGKLDVRPEVYEPQITPSNVEYSDYSKPMNDIDNNSVIPLDYSETNFTHPHPMKGFLRGGIGHSASMFNFNYSMRERKKVTLDLNVQHLGQWGKKTLSNTGLGMDITRHFSAVDLFFGADAKNIFFTRYGKYFQYTDINKMSGNFVALDHFSDFTDSDKSAQWEVNTRIGFRSRGKGAFDYSLQTGYEAFVMRHGSVEHIIDTKGKFAWQQDGHKVGANLLVENHFYNEKADILAAKDPAFYYTTLDKTDYHAIKLNPYYSYTGKRFFIKAGVNLDFCIGKGKVFLPSPDVLAEAKLTREWLAVYAGVTGSYATSSVREHFGYLRYLHPENEIATNQNRTYTPVNPFLGFKIRPIKSLLLEIYGAYNFTKYDVFYLPDQNDKGYFNLVGSNHQHWTIGAKVHYHYKDIVSIKANAFYNIWNMKANFYLDPTKTYYDMGLKEGHILDRPAWGFTLRIDAKIDSKWSLYSDNYFGGGRFALDGMGAIVELKPTIDLNLGAQYNINKWLAVFLQLNNYINRKNEVVYGYQTQGINFMVGVSYKF